MVFSGKTDKDEFIERDTEEEKWKQIIEIDGDRDEHEQDKSDRSQKAGNPLKVGRVEGGLEGS